MRARTKQRRSAGKCRFGGLMRGLRVTLLVFAVFIIVCNLILVVCALSSPDCPPSVMGTIPMVVVSGSMSGTQEGHIEEGDIVFMRFTEPDALQIGDVISFREKNCSDIITHRIVEVTENHKGELAFRTKGDANSFPDLTLVTPDRLIGKFMYRLPKAGFIAVFFHNPFALVWILLSGFILLIAIDYTCRRFADRRPSCSESFSRSYS